MKSIITTIAIDKKFAVYLTDMTSFKISIFLKVFDLTGGVCAQTANVQKY
mgnify:CR=1 FL=1